MVAAVAMLLQAAQARAADYADNSVLASGKWVKIQITESGMHQITRSALAGWGFSDITKVKLFGYGGAMISEKMGDGYVDDLPQVPVYRTADKLIFYAQGPVSWKDGNGTLNAEQTQNPYATCGYYFLTDRDDIEAASLPATGEAASDGRLITTFPDRVCHESELTAPATTGRTLLGEDFRYTSSRNFTFALTDVVEGSQSKVKVRFMSAQQGSSATLTVTRATDRICSLTFPVTSGNYAIGSTQSATGTMANTAENTVLNLNYATSGTTEFANLDYITVNYLRHLRLNGGETEFRSFTANCRDSVFALAGASDGIQIWDITTAYSPKQVAFATDASTAYFRQTETGKREYVAFNPSAAFPAPTSAGTVANQNLHALETPTMLIITPAAFRTEAERLAQLHRDNDGFRVEVVTDAAIYNEFSSGTPDAMAYRKISKMWFDRSASEADYSVGKYRYLLLFGRCVFDNRRITTAAKSLGYPTLLTWESYDCDSESSSLNTDDVFGFLEDNSDINGSRRCNLNIGIGRIPVKSAGEAAEAVDKIYEYANKADMGNWKTRIMVIADDADSGAHMRDSDREIDNLNAYGADSYLIDRVYIDAYKTASSGSGHSYPEAREKMLTNFRNGVIYASYLGHANTVSWTHNELLRWNDIENEFYYNHYPLLYTGTCEFTRWDSPEVSGGEVLYLNPRGGMIALITSSRVTGISANGDLAATLGRHVFKPLDNGEMPRIGDILKNAKNDPYYNSGSSSSGSTYERNTEHSLRYALIGDPALRLKYPEKRVEITAINGVTPTDDNMPELQARQEVEIEGRVVGTDGLPAADFEGVLTSSLYDAEVSVSTNGNDDNGTDGYVDTYQEHSNRLYIGSDSIKGGTFTMKFRMPTAIINNYTPAMLNLYAYSSDTDAIGKNEQFYVYGFDDTPSDDTTGPEIISLTLNGDTFRDGDTVNETPYLSASFRDESGINLSAMDIGHAITLILDGKTTITNLESVYSQSADKIGYINHQMDEIAEGSHTLTLRVWDTFGNMSEKTIGFSVAKGLQPQLFRIYSTANPAKTEADFYIVHNRPDALINVTISVYNMMGQQVWTTSASGRSDMYTSMPVTWDLTDGTGCRVARGIYLYRATVSTDGGEESSISNRIAVASE